MPRRRNWSLTASVNSPAPGMMASRTIVHITDRHRRRIGVAQPSRSTASSTRTRVIRGPPGVGRHRSCSRNRRISGRCGRAGTGQLGSDRPPVSLVRPSSPRRAVRPGGSTTMPDDVRARSCFPPGTADQLRARKSAVLGVADPIFWPVVVSSSRHPQRPEDREATFASEE